MITIMQVALCTAVVIGVLFLGALVYDAIKEMLKK